MGKILFNGVLNLIELNMIEFRIFVLLNQWIQLNQTDLGVAVTEESMVYCSNLLVLMLKLDFNSEDGNFI